LIFENFFKFSKKRRAVPLQPIWTGMVAAKLAQSRVLVTKFRQNRLTLMGRSAGQRHTDRGKLQNVSPSSFLFESSRTFLQCTGDTGAKNDGPELKFSKRRRAVPLQPIWTIMFAAKLDQSRVLVTKFHQNRLTLKGRSAGQRQTDKLG